MAGYHSAAEQWSLSTLDGSTVDFCSWFLDVKSLRESRDQNEFKHPEINLGYFYFLQQQLGWNGNWARSFENHTRPIRHFDRMTFTDPSQE